jgi:hypothetical protein
VAPCTVQYCGWNSSLLFVARDCPAPWRAVLGVQNVQPLHGPERDGASGQIDIDPGSFTVDTSKNECLLESTLVSLYIDTILLLSAGTRKRVSPSPSHQGMSTTLHMGCLVGWGRSQQQLPYGSCSK